MTSSAVNCDASCAADTIIGCRCRNGPGAQLCESCAVWSVVPRSQVSFASRCIASQRFAVVYEEYRWRRFHSLTDDVTVEDAARLGAVSTHAR